MKRPFPLLWVFLFGVCRAATAQTTTTVPEGVLFPTQNSARVNGVRIRVAEDGAVWFLESSADSIARLKDGVMRQWQIRPTDELGANPVDFELDGDTVWFIESGESQIPAGTFAYARLDTTTGALTEWVIPGSIPASFYRIPGQSPDELGKVWIPLSAASVYGIQLIDLDANFIWLPGDPKPPITRYRSLATSAYADMVLGPDGSLWLADFGNNRIVRWSPGSTTETSWVFFPVSGGRLNPAQIQFDENGSLWITQRSANRVDRFDPTDRVDTTGNHYNNLYSYENISAPIHLDVFQGRIYVTSIASTSQINVIDPNLAPVGLVSQLTPIELAVAPVNPVTPIFTRVTTIVPTDFASVPAAIDPTTITVSNGGYLAGLLTTTFPSSNTYGLEVVGGRVWTGTDGQLAALNLQAVGDATDLAVPMATSLAGSANSKVRIDVTVSNRGTANLAGQALYLDSPGSFAPRMTFTLAANATSLVADSFGNLASTTTLLNGPVRLGTTTGSAADLVASVRSLRVLPDGGTFGYLFPAESATTSLTAGSTTTLFTGAREGEVSILNLYSLVDAKATLTLLAPDGTSRGARDFEIAKNASLSFNPAASAFGASAEPGDAVRVAVTTGTLQTSVLVFDSGTTDVAPSLPAVAESSSVLPWVGAFPNGDRSFTSDLYLSNPSATASADVSLAFRGIGAAGSAPTASVTLAPLETLAVPDALSSLFGVAEGQGAVTLSSNVPVAASLRVATEVAAGDYGTFANALGASSGLTSAAPAFAIGLPQTATRTGLLLLYNAGSAGTVTVTGFRADGSPAGSLAVDIGPQSAAVVGPVFAALGVSNQAAGRVRLTVSGGMNVFGWAAAIDDVTGDFDLTPLE